MILINRQTGTAVTVPDSLVERFKAAGLIEPAAPVAPEVKPEPRRRRTTKTD